MLKQKTVYFREEDLPLWENIQNKAQFLHDALNGNSGRTIVAKDVPMEKVPVVPLEWTKPKPRVEAPVIPGVMKASEAKCPRHQVPFSVCAHKH